MCTQWRYDEDYNGRRREGRNRLPAVRKWNSGTISWAPERSDYPLQGFKHVATVDPISIIFRFIKSKPSACASSDSQSQQISE